MTLRFQPPSDAAPAPEESPSALPSVFPAAQKAATAVDRVTDQLVTAIAMGVYLPGSRLPAERQLAASLKVGRMTVRSAIARLVERGLLETLRGRDGGSFVREQWGALSKESVHRTLAVRWDELRDTCEAVSMLHGTIARVAATNRTDGDALILRDRLDRFRNAASGQASQKADELLHAAISEAAHNATLRITLFELESRVSIGAPTYPWGSLQTMREMELRSLADHENLVDAICRGDVERAGTVAAEHALIGIELFEAVLRNAAALPS